MTEAYNIKTEEDFDQVMDVIDKEMRVNNIPITARQIKGWLIFSSRYGLRLKMSDPLSQKVMDWFATRYGDKIKVDFAQGEIAVSIRGDLYKMYFPFFAGKIQVICDPRFWMNKRGMQIAKDKNDPLPVVNVLNCIEELTENYALTLSMAEQLELFELFRFGSDAYQDINRLKGITFIKEAKGDIDASIKHLFDNPPQYGLSKWASLQAVEKFIKGYLAQKSASVPLSHNLQALATAAESHGLPAIPSAQLAKVQCGAGVRYGQIAVTKEEALEAHHSAVAVCAAVAKNL
jgi:hypothetical protein